MMAEALAPAEAAVPVAAPLLAESMVPVAAPLLAESMVPAGAGDLLSKRADMVVSFCAGQEKGTATGAVPNGQAGRMLIYPGHDADDSWGI